MNEIGPRLLPAALAVPGERVDDKGGPEWESSFKVNRDVEVRLPLFVPGVCLTSRSAWAPKLSLLANEGLGGELPILVVSSSSITAFSSKLFRNSGEPLADEVEMLARRCLANAL